MGTYIKKPFVLLSLVLAFATSVCFLWSAQPSWWDDYSLKNSSDREDDALATVGQAKHAVQKAYQYLEAKLVDVGGAGSEVTALYNTYCVTEPSDSEDDSRLLTIGQLKYLAKPFYDRLNSAEVAFDTSSMNLASTDIYPWTVDQADDVDLALSTIGQLKFAFSFDLVSWSPPTTYTVTFDLGTEGTLLSGELTQNIVSGGTAIPPEFSVTDGLAFTGWDRTFHNVNSDLIVTAQYFDEMSVVINDQYFDEALVEIDSGDKEIFFGRSVSINGDTALVGASRDNDKKGSVYVFERSGGVWIEQDKLEASDGEALDQFGLTVGISGDTALVGAVGDDDNGSVYVFVRCNGEWYEQAKLKVDDESFNGSIGWSVSISSDTAVVCSIENYDGGRSQNAFVFVRNNDAWTQQAKLGDDDEVFGSFSVSDVSISDDTILLGAGGQDGKGSAYVFVRNNNEWIQQAELEASDGIFGDSFGNCVSLSGNIALVGNHRDENLKGSAYIFVRNNDDWTQQAKLEADDGASGDLFGQGVSISGDIALIGSYGDEENGSAYVFVHSNGAWEQRFKVKASDQIRPLGRRQSIRFGQHLDVDGDTFLVGTNLAKSGGQAYFYDFRTLDLSDDIITTNENEAVTIDVLENDIYMDVDRLLPVSLPSVPVTGVAVVNSDNTITFTPPAFFNGTIQFDYTVEYSSETMTMSNSTAIATVTIEVLPVNDAPVALFDYTVAGGVSPFDVTFDGSDSYDDLAVVEYRWDFDGDGITDSSVTQPQFQFDSAAAQTVSLTVLDAEGLRDTQEQLLVFNQPPEVQIVSPNNLERFKVGETIDILIEASDSDGQVQTIILLNENGDEIAQTTPSSPLFSLDNLVIGSHGFTAKAVDNDGATAESIPIAIQVYKTSGDFIVQPLLLEAMLTEISSEDNAEQNYTIRYSATDPELTQAFEDIRNTGTLLETVSVSDDASEEVTISFDFPFYGQTFTNLYVGSNGLIVLGSSGGADQYTNYPLPSENAPFNLIAPLWSDLYPTNLGGGEYGGGTFDEITEVHYQEFEDRLIIQYSDMSDYLNNGLNTFQVVLYADGVIDFVYDNVDINFGFDYVVGLQNETGEIGVQVDPNWLPFDSPLVRFEPVTVSGIRAFENFFTENYYDQPVTYTITPLDNTVDSLPGDPTWFEVMSSGNTLNTNESDSVQVGFIADPGFPVGRYEGKIRVDHTQPGLDSYIVNIALEVVADAPKIDWIYPVVPGYVLLGQSLPLEVRAEDANGFIQSLAIDVDDVQLQDFTTAPYVHDWTPPTIGSYTLKATATDNDGNVVESTFDLVVTEDSDNDDLPDQWEMDFLETLDFSGLDSPDDDDLSNLKEFFLGTDPNSTDAGSFENLSPSISLSITPFDTGEVPFTVSFDASASTDPDGKIVSYEWDFDGDGAADQTTTTATIEYTYTEPNRYTTILRVVDDEGASSVTTNFIHAKVPGTSVPPSAVIDFEVNVPATGQLIDFSALRSTDADGFIVDYQWDFSDGMRLSGSEVQRHFMMNGRYSVTLTVMDNEGMTDVITEWISVLGPNRSPGTVDDLWVVSGADYTYTMIDRDCGNWRRTRENSVFNNSDYETPVAGFGEAAEVGYTFYIEQAGDYYLALLKQNSTVFNVVTISGGGLDVYLDNRRVSPDNGYFNEIDAEPTWGRYGRFYLEPGYHTIAFEKREDSFFEIYRVALARSKESLPTTGSVTQSPQINSFENEIIPLPEISISSTADAEVVKLGEVVNFSLDEAASDLPNPILNYFWITPSGRLNEIKPVLSGFLSGEYSSNNPSISFAPEVFNSVGENFEAIQLLITDSKGRYGYSYKAFQITDPVADLSVPSEIILESEDVVPGSWRRYEEVNSTSMKIQVPFRGIVDVEINRATAFFLRGETYLATDTGRFGGSLDLSIPATSNTKYLALYYNPDIFLFQPSPGNPFVNDATFLDEDGNVTDEGLRSSSVRVDYLTNGEMKSALVDMRYQQATWNWFAVIDSGASAEIDMSLNNEEDKHAAFDGLKLIPVETANSQDNQIPELVVTTDQISDYIYAFDASQSTDNDGEILGYLWNFGDGTVSRSSIPQHTYESPGSYEVTLYVLDDDLYLSEWSFDIIVTSNDITAPAARLSSSLNQGTVPFEVNFSGELSTDNKAVTEYEIRLPDETIVFDSEAEYIFTTPGEYQIELKVFDDAGNESSAFRTVEAFAPGIVFNRSFVVEDSDVTATEFVGDGWQSTSVQLGNQLNSLTSSPNAEDLAWFNFTPERSGLYQVFVAASYIEPPFSYECGLETEVQMDAFYGDTIDERSVFLESNADLSLVRKWHLAGTFDLNAFEPFNVQIQSKSETAELSIDAMRWIAVDAGIVPAFTLELNDRTELEVNADASTASEGIVAYNWDFGDGTEATGLTASHSYADAGFYTVTLMVTDTSGRKASASETVRILPENSLPQIQFDVSSDQGTAPLEVELDASASTDADGRIIRYLWDFGDGRVGDGVSVRHNYVSPGTYTLTLTLIDDRGGQNNESVNITVQAPASGYTGNVTRSVETPLVNQSVVFDASTLVSGGSVFTYAWDFGDGVTSADAQPTHTYTTSGVYLVSVEVTDENGLQTTQTFWVSVTEGEGPSNLPVQNDPGTGLLVYPPFDAVQ